LLSAYADNNLRKNPLRRVFLCPQNGAKQFFFGFSRIASPQVIQNLVDYHPIFCPIARDCSFFVEFMNENAV
jgi:hypothetical protein